MNLRFPLRFRIVAMAIALALLGCADGSVAPPGGIVPTPDDLLSAPSQLTIDGHTYELWTYLWRDFQPFSPPDGKPLIALVRLVDVDSRAVPADVTLEYLWVVNGTETWATEFSGEERPPQPDHTIERVARGGPKWGPDVAVDVVARVRVGDSGESRILSSDQPIERTD
ncbi:MAG: hypothetical protein R3E97_19945 [Candidatus Eisenbacteria bacterium]